MGVTGLWDVIQHTSETRSLTHLAVVDGFQQNISGLRGYRIGIDASIWFFHAKSSKEGENPELRLIFFRLAKLLSEPFLPLFVFDGPGRPNWKRGIQINKKPHWLLHGVKVMINAFGFEWRQAPGEAEAELAWLNRMGVIDGVLSDDVDNFLFGAKTVIRNPGRGLTGNLSNPALNSEGRDDGNHVRIFDSAKIAADEKAGLNRAGFILMGLLSGGDYEEKDVPGSKLPNCGIKTAHALARAGFGQELIAAFQTLALNDFTSSYLPKWRNALCEELRTNSRGLLARKEKKLAENVPDAFPNIDVLKAYVLPVTTETKAIARGRDPKLEVPQMDSMWRREHSLASLAQFCEEKFEWGTTKIIPKRFRSLLWHGSVIRILRRTTLDLDQGVTIPGARARSTEKPRGAGQETQEEVQDDGDKTLAAPSTPTKKKSVTVDGRAGGPIGTPSKLITKYFSTVSLNSPTKPRVLAIDGEEEEEDHPLIAKIASSTTSHANTDGLLEYRVEIDPHQLVHLTVSGVEGVREEPVEGSSDLSGADDGGDDDEGETKKGKRKPTVVDPFSLHRIWVPGCMLEAVEGELVRLYEEAKAKKGKKGQPKIKSKMVKETSSTGGGKNRPPAKGKSKSAPVKPSKATLPSDDGDDGPEKFNLDAVPHTSESDANSDAEPSLARKRLKAPAPKPKSQSGSVGLSRPGLAPTKSTGIPSVSTSSSSSVRPNPKSQSTPLLPSEGLPSTSRGLGTSRPDIPNQSKGKGKSLVQALDDEWDDLFPVTRPSAMASHAPSSRPPSPPAPRPFPLDDISGETPRTTIASASEKVHAPKQPKRPTSKRGALSSSESDATSKTSKAKVPPKSPRKSKEQTSPRKSSATAGDQRSKPPKKPWKTLSSSESESDSEPRKADRKRASSPSPIPKKPTSKHDDSLDFFASPARAPSGPRAIGANNKKTKSKQNSSTLPSLTATVVDLSDSDPGASAVLSRSSQTTKAKISNLDPDSDSDDDDDSALHPSTLFRPPAKEKFGRADGEAPSSNSSSREKAKTETAKVSKFRPVGSTTTTQRKLPIYPVIKTTSKPPSALKKGREGEARNTSPDRRLISVVIDLTSP